MPAGPGAAAAVLPGGPGAHQGACPPPCRPGGRAGKQHTGAPDGQLHHLHSCQVPQAAALPGLPHRHSCRSVLVLLVILQLFHLLETLAFHSASDFLALMSRLALTHIEGELWGVQCWRMQHTAGVRCRMRSLGWVGSTSCWGSVR